VSFKDYKPFAADLKTVYTAASEEQALDELCQVKRKEKWESKYPYSVISWENNWENISTFFKFPYDIRKIIYTTNVIESLHRQYHKVTKAKTIFPTDDSLLKMLYLATGNIMKK